MNATSYKTRKNKKLKKRMLVHGTRLLLKVLKNDCHCDEVEYHIPSIEGVFPQLFKILHGYPLFHVHCCPIPNPNRKNHVLVKLESNFYCLDPIEPSLTHVLPNQVLQLLFSKTKYYYDYC